MCPPRDRAGDVVTILRGWATDQGPARLSRLLVAHNVAGLGDGLLYFAFLTSSRTGGASPRQR